MHAIGELLGAYVICSHDYSTQVQAGLQCGAVITVSFLILGCLQLWKRSLPLHALALARAIANSRRPLPNTRRCGGAYSSLLGGPLAT